MGKKQNGTKESEGQGVCERIFKLLSSSRRQMQSSKSATNSSSTKQTVATTDRHRSDPTKSSRVSKPLALHQPPGSIIPLQFNDQNMVLVEYNHCSGDTTKFKDEPARDYQDPKGGKAESVNKFRPKGVKSEDYTDSSIDRFSKYIDHVKNKMKTVYSFDGADVEDVGSSATTLS